MLLLYYSMYHKTSTVSPFLIGKGREFHNIKRSNLSVIREEVVEVIVRKWHKKGKAFFMRS